MLILIIVFALAFSIMSYTHGMDIDSLEENARNMMAEKDKYIDELRSELRYKQYEVDNVCGYKSK